MFSRSVTDPVESIPKILFWTWFSVLSALVLLAGHILWSAKSYGIQLSATGAKRTTCITTVSGATRGRYRKHPCPADLVTRGRRLLHGASR